MLRQCHRVCSTRYFVGEVVEAIVNNQWCDCKVLSVLPPTDEEIAQDAEVSGPQATYTNKGNTFVSFSLGGKRCRGERQGQPIQVQKVEEIVFAPRPPV